MNDSNKTTIRDTISWTPSQAHAIAKQVLFAGQDSNVPTGPTINPNVIQEELLKGAPLNELTEDQRDAVSSIAMAITLDQLADFCKQFAENAIKDARNAGATWNDIALGTGYSSPAAASQRFDPRLKQKQREASARRDAKRRAALSRLKEQAEQ